jgi:hypothetical protein
MNASFALGAAFVAAALVGSPANASVSSAKALRDAVAPTFIVNADFVQGHEAVAGFPAREAMSRAVLSKQAAERYYDFDIIVTLGALALASGAFVAAGIAGSRRRNAYAGASNEGWREHVMQAVEVELAQFTVSLKRAA